MPNKYGSEVVLVRHGETEWSLSGQHTGSTDLPLTENGREDARIVGRRLAGREFARVLTSPLGRAVQTCKLAGYGGQAEKRDGLREWDYGEYEGRTTSDIREERPGWWLWRDGCPGGEQAADVGRRVDRIIAELRELDGDAIIFAHGHLLRVFATRWVELPPDDGARFALGTATLSTLGYERETPVFWAWNTPIV